MKTTVFRRCLHFKMAASMRKCLSILRSKCDKLLRDLRVITSTFEQPCHGLEFAGVMECPISSRNNQTNTLQDRPSKILESIFNNVLLAVQRDRRSLERRLTRKMALPGHYERAIPRTDIIACLECGHWHEKGTLCGHCYEKVRKETEKMREKLGEDMMYTADQKEVVFLYEEETVDGAKCEGKHIVKLDGSRPSWFPKSLYAKKES